MKNPILPPRDSIVADLHPVLTHQYTLVTPMIEALLSTLVEWIRRGITGSLIIGDSRLGKTRCRRLILQVLGQYFAGMPVFSMIARDYVYLSERVFFGDLLRAFRHKLFGDGTAAQRRDRLTESVVRTVRASGQNRVVLLIDQAHKLKEMHYEWLIDFYDEVNEHGIEIFVFLFGQKELVTICDEFRRTGKTQIVGRFMIDRFEYTGIRTQAQLRACLVAYDEHSRYPDGTDWTYTRYFFPKPFAAGWRLAGTADAFMKAFKEVRSYSPHAGKFEIPMLNFTQTVEQFLIAAEMGEDGQPTVTHDKLVRYVTVSRFGVLPQTNTTKFDDDGDGESDES